MRGVYVNQSIYALLYEKYIYIYIFLCVRFKTGEICESFY